MLSFLGCMSTKAPYDKVVDVIYSGKRYRVLIDNQFMDHSEISLVFLCYISHLTCLCSSRMDLLPPCGKTTWVGPL